MKNIMKIGCIVLGESVLAELAADGFGFLLAEIGVKAAALYHETRNDPVENQTVIETGFYQGYKILNRQRCFFRVKFRGHFTDVPDDEFHFHRNTARILQPLSVHVGWRGIASQQLGNTLRSPFC